MTEMAVNNADTCPTWPALLAWLANDLSEKESQLLSTHVADCDECREKLALMNAVGAAPLSLLNAGPDSLLVSVPVRGGTAATLS